jgi:hypothetical protein
VAIGEPGLPCLAYIGGMNDDELKRARNDSRRYWLHNLYLGPDLGRIASEYLSAPRSARWIIACLIVALIMIGPVIGILVATIG